MMALVHTFTLLSMQHNIHVHIQHIAGVNNDIADALSCFKMDRFSAHMQRWNPFPRSIFGSSAGAQVPSPRGIPSLIDSGSMLSYVTPLTSVTALYRTPLLPQGGRGAPHTVYPA